MIYNTAKQVSYKINYDNNSKLQQPTGFVYAQKAYSAWKFGFFNMADRGCEVIAGYNLAHAKGYNFLTLADVIYLYEALGMEIGSAQGFFGSNPYQISYFLNTIGISYKKVINYNTFEKYMNDGNYYYVILSRWNSENPIVPLHTFLIDKDKNYSSTYHAYNYYGYLYYEKNKITDNSSVYSSFFDKKSSIKNTFICAYFVSK